MTGSIIDRRLTRLMRRQSYRLWLFLAMFLAVCALITLAHISRSAEIALDHLERRNAKLIAEAMALSWSVKAAPDPPLDQDFTNRVAPYFAAYPQLKSVVLTDTLFQPVASAGISLSEARAFLQELQAQAVDTQGGQLSTSIDDLHLGAAALRDREQQWSVLVALRNDKTNTLTGEVSVYAFLLVCVLIAVGGYGLQALLGAHYWGRLSRALQSIESLYDQDQTGMRPNANLGATSPLHPLPPRLHAELAALRALRDEAMWKASQIEQSIPEFRDRVQRILAVAEKGDAPDRYTPPAACPSGENC